MSGEHFSGHRLRASRGGRDHRVCGRGPEHARLDEGEGAGSGRRRPPRRHWGRHRAAAVAPAVRQEQAVPAGERAWRDEAVAGAVSPGQGLVGEHGRWPAPSGPVPLGHLYARVPARPLRTARRRPPPAEGRAEPGLRTPPVASTHLFTRVVQRLSATGAPPPSRHPPIWLIPPPHALLYGLPPRERLRVAPREPGPAPDTRTPQLRCDHNELRRRTPTVSAQRRSLPQGGGEVSAGSRRAGGYVPVVHIPPDCPATARGKARRVRPSSPASHTCTESTGGTTDRRPAEHRPAPPCHPPAE